MKNFMGAQFLARMTMTSKLYAKFHKFNYCFINSYKMQIYTERLFLLATSYKV